MDHIARGRFSLGVGLGNAAMWRRFGLDPATVGERMDEMILALRALWAGEPGFHGRLIDVDGPIGPLPIQPGGPSIWVGGKIKRTARRAAALGDGLVIGTHFGWEHARWLIAEYRAALADLGRAPDEGRVSANRLLVLAEDPEQAWRDCAPSLGTLMRRYAKAKMIPGGDALLAAAPDDLDALRAAATDICLVGSPETVLPELERIAAEGVSQMQVRPAPYGMPMELVARTLELAARDVLPRFS
jgi:alkanesulfonate monooxygenase SsuD/methylene tetrahydromethanopterin reductase-like flavin-dependent oxidoreductase (luciferase family)